MTEQYKNYLKSNTWAEKKRKRLIIDGGKCACCGRPAERTRKMQCHHIRYSNLGNEDIYRDLVSVCSRCHSVLHRYYDRIQSPNDERLKDRKEDLTCITRLE